MFIFWTIYLLKLQKRQLGGISQRTGCAPFVFISLGERFHFVSVSEESEDNNFEIFN